LAALWGIVFAIPHLLWGLGWFGDALRFSLGVEPGPEEERVIGDAMFRLTGLWGVAALCLLASAIALMTVHPVGGLPRWIPVAGCWAACAILAARALVFPVFVGSIAIELGLLDLPAGSDPAWHRWNLVLWSPWFLIGAVLFGWAARHGMRASA
jgi:hypothetical protein